MTVSTIQTRGLTLTGIAQQLIGIGSPRVGVTIRAGSSDVYFGYESTVTAGTSDATDGMRIPAEGKEFITISDAGRLYVIGTSSDKITYIVE